jgi:hypothetical protein
MYVRAFGGTGQDDDVARLGEVLRLLALLHARWRGGTFFSPTPDEDAFCFGTNQLPTYPASLAGAVLYIMCALLAQRVLAGYTQSAEERDVAAYLHGMHGALQLTRELAARGIFVDDVMPGQQTLWTPLLRLTLLPLVDELLAAMLRTNAAAWRPLLRETCGMTATEEAALRQVAQRYASAAQPVHDAARTMSHDNILNEMRDRAAADTARHGLRACALPECSAVEPHPKAFKLCSRCRGAAYCSAVHQRADWRRQKRADGCTAAAAAAT